MYRLTVIFEGRVQGVGFRATVCDLASHYQVVGQVRNMCNGSVELVAEGDLAELRRFCEAIRERLQRNIVEQHESWLEIPALSVSCFRIATSE